jgi:hypothetical protein
MRTDGAIGVVVCVLGGAAGYFAVVQPYIGRSAVGWVAATLALGFAIRAVLDASFSRPAYVFPDPIPFRHVGNDRLVKILGAQGSRRTREAPASSTPKPARTSFGSRPRMTGSLSGLPSTWCRRG